VEESGGKNFIICAKQLFQQEEDEVEAFKQGKLHKNLCRDFLIKVSANETKRGAKVKLMALPFLARPGFTHFPLFACVSVYLAL